MLLVRTVTATTFINKYLCLYCLAGYEILNIIALITKSSLVERTPEVAPVYTEDGTTVLNPAVGYSHLISTSICSDSPQGPNQAACIGSHGANSFTTLNNQ